MSLFTTIRHPARSNLPSLVLDVWRAHQERRAAQRALARLLDGTDDHLLVDIGLDRAQAHGLLGETLVQPHRAWDRWQL